MSDPYKNVGPRHGACDNYSWSATSAITKGWQMVTGGGRSEPNVAFRSCGNCGQHSNYHKSGKRAP